MSDSLKSIFFTVLRSAVCGYKLTDAEREAVRGADAEKLAKLAAVHDLSHLLAYGLDKNDLADAEAKNEIFKSAFRCEQLNYELDSLCAALEKASIPFIPLKGSVIRKYYPEPWMRNSCDIDVLVHKEDCEQATAVLVDVLGYVYDTKGSHDISLFSPSKVHVELHYDLVEDGRANEAASVLKTVWDRAYVRKGCEYLYEMHDDMFYFYHIAHMAKHFEIGGCGIRSFIDLWILDRLEGVDKAARDAALSRGGLLRFAYVSRQLSEIWLSGNKHSLLTERMEDYIVCGGTYGSLENRIAVQQLKKGGRIKYALSRVFLPYDAIKFYYPILEKHRWLTPIMEVRRWFRLVFCGHIRRSVKELNLNHNISEDASIETKQFLTDVGLM